MAKFKFSFFLSALTALLFIAGCNADDSNHPSGLGSFKVKLVADSKTIDLGNSLNSATRSAQDSIQTRATDDDAPSTDNFELYLYSNNVLTNYWEKFSQYDAEEEMPIGKYQVKAVYGDINEEGYYRPCYMGTTDFQVRDRETTEVEVVCQLANVKLTVQCSEAVKKYFSVFSMSARSDLGTNVIITRDETRSIYLKPGLLVLSAEFEKQNGKTGNVELLRIEGTDAKQHYIVSVDVNQGNVGSGTLQITYNTVKSEETKDIDLSDASLNITQPTLTTQGFENGETKTLREGAQPEAMKVTLNARAGLQTCELTVNSPYLNSLGIAQNVDLLSTDAAQTATKEALIAKGLRLVGLKQGEKLALIDFTPLVMNLLCTGYEDETSTFTLRATDVHGRIQKSEVTFSMVMQNNLFALPEIADAVMISSTQAYAQVNLLPEENSLNGEVDVENVIFEYQDGEVWKTATTEWEGDDLSDKKVHFVWIKNLPAVHSKMNIRARYGSKTSETRVLNYYIPDFTLSAESADIWARKATVKVSANTDAELKAVLKYMKLFNSGIEIASLNENMATYTINNLNPGTTYNLTADCNAAKVVNFALTTESALQLPNSNFEGAWNTTYNATINKGGPWVKKTSGFLTSSYTKTYETFSLVVDEPAGWCSVNVKTIPTTANQKNTWFCVPSTFQSSNLSGTGNNSICLRNVGWNNLGQEIPLLGSLGGVLGSGGQGWSSCPGFESLNTPNHELTYSAGRLFLGSYSCSHSTTDVNAYTENYTEGYNFVSRPVSIQFDYKYIAKVDPSGDKGFVRIDLKDAQGNSILSNKIFEELEHTGENVVKTGKITFAYPANCAKAASINVMFCSSIKGKNDNEKDISKHDIVHSTYKSQCCVTGSELYIDNIQLNY